MNTFCCFTGHRCLTMSQIRKIGPLLIREINFAYTDGIRVFYTAEAGSFDCLVIRLLKELQVKYTDIKIIILHSVKKRKSMSEANEVIKLTNFFDEYKKIIKNADRLICFVENFEGCAFKLMSFAENFKIKVINIAEKDE